MSGQIELLKEGLAEGCRWDLVDQGVDFKLDFDVEIRMVAQGRDYNSGLGFSTEFKQAILKIPHAAPGEASPFPARIPIPLSAPFILPKGWSLNFTARTVVFSRRVDTAPPRDVGEQVDAAIQRIGAAIVGTIAVATLKEEVRDHVLKSPELRTVVSDIVRGGRNG